MEFVTFQTLLKADSILVTTMSREVGKLEANLGISVVGLGCVLIMVIGLSGVQFSL